MKKIYILISIFILSFMVFLLILYLPKNYKLTYKINNFQITESYSLEKQLYQFIINDNDKSYPLLLLGKYHRNRKIIQKISEIGSNDENCLIITIANNIHPICYKDDKLVDYRLLSQEIKDQFKDDTSYSNEIKNEYNNTNIYNYYAKDFYIWNYKGYDFLNENEHKTINLLDEDNYNNNLVFKNNRYLITPNYDEQYYFTKYMIIDHEKTELFELEFNKEIAYNSYYLGEHKNNIYLVDKKNKKEYKINIKKESISEIGNANKKGTIYTGKWENISLNKLVNNEYTFSEKIIYDYKIINEHLYLDIDNNLILITNNKVKYIVYIDQDEVYYLAKDVLYIYTPKIGEVKLLENSEWNFNYKNTIFIFD